MSKIDTVLTQTLANVMKFYTNLRALPKAWPYFKKSFLIMKLTTLILFIAFLNVSAKTYSQVTLREKNASLEETIKAIKEQTGYFFIYSDQEIKTKPITVDLKNASVEKALDECFKDQPVSFKIIDKNIILQLKEQSLFDQARVYLAQVTVTGKVIDETGQPMTGVTVRVKDLNTATLTDNKGFYEITVPDEKTTIVFSFIGFESQEYTANELTKIKTITLKASNTNLKEVVVNKGYYTTTQLLNTGSVSSVNASQIAQEPINNPLTALQGRVTGAFITQGSGLPGSSFSLLVRGQNAIPADGLVKDTNPFFVIDGVPYMDQTLGLVNTNLSGGNPLNYINPQDIETIDILKDADATAIYGSRGANGVVLITTKKGKIGATKITANVYGGYGKVTKLPQLLNTQQYISMREEALKNDGLPIPSITTDPTDYNYDIDGAWSKDRYTDWAKYFWGGAAQYRNVDLSVSGGNNNTQYLISGTWHREATVYNDPGADTKAAFHFGLNSASSNQKFKISFFGNYVNDNNTVQSLGSFSDLLLPPNAPTLYNADGTLNWAPLTPGGVGTWTNPLAHYLYSHYSAITDNLVGDVIMSYQLTNGLTIKASGGYTVTRTDEKRQLPLKYYDPGYHFTTGNQSTFGNANNRSWIVEPQLNYNNTFGKAEINTLIGSTFQQQENQRLQTTGTNFSSDALLSNLSAASVITINSSSQALYRYSAIYGRIGMTWDNKYVLNITARRDASSRFGPDRQFANFFSTGAAWIFSNENFSKDLFPWLSLGKIRGSYGITGSDQISDYYFMDLYSSVSKTYDEIKGLQPTRFYNPVLGWESTKKLEVGVDLGFINDRINLSVDYYRNRSGNQLLNQPLPISTGFGTIITNIDGSVQNTGLEIVLNTVNVKSPDFHWQSNFNLTMPQNKLLRIPDYLTLGDFTIGKPITQIKVPHLVGIDSVTGAYIFSDGNGGTTSTSAAATAYMNTAPKLYGGFDNNISYKNFSLDILFSFVKQTGRSIFSGIGNPPGDWMVNQPTYVLDRWQNNGDRNIYQRFTQDYSTDAYRAYSSLINSDFTYVDASYIRLKNLALSWSVPRSLTARLKLDDVKFYFQGQNLLTITSYKGLDPETQGVSLPPLRVYTLGIQATF
ncbi:SusC/RagA family TonB-linked outer membrane protein [Mucilaginibacter corticis]|uniref:SusC/RagA family TonB-linked outer membrane protein n=1 Tax=Mucilaginibacter corticis TaxID=2597670 RepID=A0A556M9J1_9SPHI|nr:SusC/RagA family TonB-linked outer membrane protein [Mucilaginibacter corticis]TSJ36579.1 SusC/RagA family TonB-linked outer membrane protein [Mucilaginibacter corticis]